MTHPNMAYRNAKRIVIGAEFAGDCAIAIGTALLVFALVFGVAA